MENIKDLPEIRECPTCGVYLDQGTVLVTRIQYKCRKCGAITTTCYMHAGTVYLQIMKLECTNVPQEQLDKDEEFLVNLQEILEELCGSRVGERLICRQIFLYKPHVCPQGGFGLSDNIGTEHPIELAFDDPRLDQ